MAKKKLVTVTKVMLPPMESEPIRRQFPMRPGVFSRLTAIAKDEGRPFVSLVEHVVSALAFGDIDIRDLRPLGHYRKEADGS